MRSLFTLLLLSLCGSALAAVSPAAESAREAARAYGAAVRACDMAWAVDEMYPPLRRTYADKLGSRKAGSESQNAKRIMGLTKETPEEARKRQDANDKALRAQYQKMGKDLKAKGVNIESYTVGTPYAEYVVTPPLGTVKAVRKDTKADVRPEDISSGNDRCRIVVLPTTLVVSAPGNDGKTQRSERRHYIFAVRDEVINDSATTGGGNATVSRTRGTKLNKWYFIDGNTDVNTLRTYFPDLPLNIKLPPSGDRVLR